MTKHLVSCNSYKNKKWYNTEIDSSCRVYPCCTLHARYNLEKSYFDEYLDSLPLGWNDATKHTIDFIMSIWRNHIQAKFWEKENTIPECCIKCKVT